MEIGVIKPRMHYHTWTIKKIMSMLASSDNFIIIDFNAKPCFDTLLNAALAICFLEKKDVV
jgi:hypothetical protein